jgi:hypothetical protein
MSYETQLAYMVSLRVETNTRETVHEPTKSRLFSTTHAQSMEPVIDSRHEVNDGEKESVAGPDAGP